MFGSVDEICFLQWKKVECNSLCNMYLKEMYLNISITWLNIFLLIWYVYEQRRVCLIVCVDFHVAVHLEKQTCYTDLFCNHIQEVCGVNFISECLVDLYSLSNISGKKNYQNFITYNSICYETDKFVTDNYIAVVPMLKSLQLRYLGLHCCGPYFSGSMCIIWICGISCVPISVLQNKAIHEGRDV